MHSKSISISLHDLKMASVALSAPRMGSTRSVSRESHSVLIGTTNKAQNANMELAIHMHLKEKASVAPGKWKVQSNSVKGVLDGLGISHNKFYYELSKAVAGHNQSDSSDSIRPFVTCQEQHHVMLWQKVMHDFSVVVWMKFYVLNVNA
jgi:hypothetical protein